MNREGGNAMLSILAYYSNYITIVFIVMLLLIVIFMFFDVYHQNKKASRKRVSNQNLPLMYLERGNEKNDEYIE